MTYFQGTRIYVPDVLQSISCVGLTLFLQTAGQCFATTFNVRTPTQTVTKISTDLRYLSVNRYSNQYALVKRSTCNYTKPTPLQDTKIDDVVFRLH